TSAQRDAKDFFLDCGDMLLLYFFFQAEDGIRDGHVTGVQTCALPISQEAILDGEIVALDKDGMPRFQLLQPRVGRKSGIEALRRSEERRVGKECRSRWARDQ